MRAPYSSVPYRHVLRARNCVCALKFCGDKEIEHLCKMEAPSPTAHATVAVDNVFAALGQLDVNTKDFEDILKPRVGKAEP